MKKGLNMEIIFLTDVSANKGGVSTWPVYNPAIRWKWKFLENGYENMHVWHGVCNVPIIFFFDKVFFTFFLILIGTLLCKVSKIYTPICSFFRKRVVKIVISEQRLVSNESSGNFTFYRGIHEFLNPSIFVKITVFWIYISQKILWNGKHSPKTVIFFPKCGDFKFCYIL